MTRANILAIAQDEVDVLQEDVLQLIEVFLNRVVCRPIVDLHRRGGFFAELVAMWCIRGPEDPKTLRLHCNKVISKVLCVREDVDIRWSMLGLDNQEPIPKNRLLAMRSIVVLLLELREKELQRTFEWLGFPEEDNMPCSPATLCH